MPGMSSDGGVKAGRGPGVQRDMQETDGAAWGEGPACVENFFTQTGRVT